VVLASPAGAQAAFAIGDTVRAMPSWQPCCNSAASGAPAQWRWCRCRAIPGGQLGIADWHARATPEDKLAFVGQLQQAGKRVLMVGDGINDAPVLARADVSLAMGGGTDVARASGDMVLMGDQLALIPQALALSRKPWV
jgi:Cu2+-exporting ATPase